MFAFRKKKKKMSSEFEGFLWITDAIVSLGELSIPLPDGLVIDNFILILFTFTI